MTTFRFWFGFLASYRFNPFAAMVAARHERDFYLAWLQKTEAELGHSVEPPETAW